MIPSLATLEQIGKGLLNPEVLEEGVSRVNPWMAAAAGLAIIGPAAKDAYNGYLAQKKGEKDERERLSRGSVSNSLRKHSSESEPPIEPDSEADGNPTPSSDGALSGGGRNTVWNSDGSRNDGGASRENAARTQIAQTPSTPANKSRYPTKDELNKLYPRASHSKGFTKQLWEENTKGGKVYDPSGVQIKPGDYWESGHKTGHKFDDAQKRAYDQGWTKEMWLQYQRDSGIYRPELLPTNRSHRHESEH